MRDSFEGQVVKDLTPLVKELTELEDWPQLRLDNLLLLYDVCTHLRLSEPIILDLLGPAGSAYLVKRGVVERKSLSEGVVGRVVG